MAFRCAPYALVKLRCRCRSCLPCLYRWTCLRCSLFAHLLPRVRSVVCALLASVPWTLVLGTLIRYHKRNAIVNPLAKLFFSPAAYYEIATLSPRTQIDPYSNIKPRHPSPRTTAEQISTARKRSQKSLRQAQRAEARRENLPYRRIKWREQRKQARPRARPRTHTAAHTRAHAHTRPRAYTRGRAAAQVQEAHCI